MMSILHKNNTRSNTFSSIKIIAYIISCGYARHTINHPLIVINKCVSKMYWGILPILIILLKSLVMHFETLLNNNKLVCIYTTVTIKKVFLRFLHCH